MKDSVFAGDIPALPGVDDGVIAAASVGRYAPNSWTLHYKHGNGNVETWQSGPEWTSSDHPPYPYHDNDGRNRRT